MLTLFAKSSLGENQTLINKLLARRRLFIAVEFYEDEFTTEDVMQVVFASGLLGCEPRLSCSSQKINHQRLVELIERINDRAFEEKMNEAIFGKAGRLKHCGVNV